MRSKKTRQKRVICIPCDLKKHQQIIKDAAIENFWINVLKMHPNYFL